MHVRACGMSPQLLFCRGLLSNVLLFYYSTVVSMIWVRYVGRCPNGRSLIELIPVASVDR